MGSPEMGLVSRIVIRRFELFTLDLQLHTLNLQFPGERKMKKIDRNPEYQAQRSGILARRHELARMQNEDRKTFRSR